MRTMAVPREEHSQLVAFSCKDHGERNRCAGRCRRAPVSRRQAAFQAKGPKASDRPVLHRRAQVVSGVHLRHQRTFSGRPERKPAGHSLPLGQDLRFGDQHL